LIDTLLPPTRRLWERVRRLTVTSSSSYVKEKTEENVKNCIRTFIIDFCLFSRRIVVAVLLLLLRMMPLMLMSTHRQDNGVFFPSSFFFSITIIAFRYIYYVYERDKERNKI